MTATGRLLFLLLVTGLFIRVWSEDTREVTERRLARVRARNAHVVVYRVPDRLPEPTLKVTSANSRAERGAVESPLPKLWRITNCRCPLPIGLTAGTFRVVDDVGQVGVLEVTNDDLAFFGLPTDFPRLDFHTRSTGTGTWYFIRLRSATSDVTTAVMTPDETPVTIGSLPYSERRRFNRKFDFTGYQ